MEVKVTLTIDEIAELFINSAMYQTALEFSERDEDFEAFEILMNEALFSFCEILNISEDNFDNFTKELMEKVEELEKEEE